MCRGWVLLYTMAVALLAEAIPARPKPEEYKTQQKLGKITLAAEFHMHTLPGGRRNFLTEDYVVVEVAVYPAKGLPIVVSNGHFVLRLNGKKPGLMAQSPGFVAAAMKYPDWEQRRTVELGGGVGDGGVIVGRPRTEPRFPGDQRPPQRPVPEPPKAPGIEPERVEEITAEEAIRSMALEEGMVDLPIAGYLYFPLKGKLKRPGTVELIYSGPAGDATLKLQ
jgi:hypothetical protein